MDELKIERDARVLAGDREVGRVTHVIVDPQTKEIAQVVVAHGERESALPITAVARAGGGTVHLRDGAEAALRGDFVRESFHGIDDRTADAENAGTALHGGAPLRDAEADAVVVARPEATADRETQHANTAQTDRAIHVPVAEERMAVGKRAVERGEVAIRKTVTEEEQTVPVTLTREEIRVEERAVAERPATGEDLFQERTFRVPLRGEEAVVAKEAVVTGEVVVEKDAVAEERRITDTVRRVHVDVDKAYEEARPGFEREHTAGAATTGRTFAQAEPHYRAGFTSAHDDRYADRDFAAAEPELRRTYEADPASAGGDSWERLREEVRAGWNRARGH